MSNIANLKIFPYFVISNNKSFISQNLKVVGPLGGKFNFFSPSGFEIQSDFDYITSKIKFHSVRALKCYLNEKNLIHGRVTATISKFSPQIFETYFSMSWKGLYLFFESTLQFSDGIKKLIEALIIQLYETYNYIECKYF